MGRLEGWAVNQDGRSNGLTAPNGPSQVRLIREALGKAGAESGREVQVLEAHGTGTPLGDPIEVQAVSEALGNGGSRGPLVMGSAKTNFGHAETAAGVLGVLKVVLCLEKKEVSRHLHLTQLNSFIGTSMMEGMRAVVAHEAVAWRSGGAGRRLAGVSSFGFSGTNAHVLISDVTVFSAAGTFVVPSVLPLRLSAKSLWALREQGLTFLNKLVYGEQNLVMWFCAQSFYRRSMFSYTCTVVGRSSKDLVKLLTKAKSVEDTSIFHLVLDESGATSAEMEETHKQLQSLVANVTFPLPLYNFRDESFG